MSTRLSSLKLPKGFWRSTAVITGALLFIVALLGVANANSGPRVRQVSIRGGRSNADVSRQVVVFSLNRPVTSDLPKVSISPAAAYELKATKQGYTVLITAGLDYETTYKITLTGIKDTFGNIAGPAAVKFHTRPAIVRYLERGAGSKDGKPTDRIYERQLPDGKPQIIAEARMIRFYAPTKNGVAYVTKAPEGDTLTFRTGKRTVPIPITAGAHVTSFSGSETQDLLVYGLSMPDKDGYSVGRVYLYDIASRKQYEMNGLDGKPLQVLRASFAPDGTSVIYQTYSTAFFLSDPRGSRKPVPLGQYDMFGAFNAAGNKLLLQKPTGAYVQDADNGQNTRLPDMYDTSDRLQFLRSSDGYVVTSNNINDDLQAVQKISLAGAEKKPHELYSGLVKKTLIDNTSTSPNDAYLNFESAPSASIYDDYEGNSKPKDVGIVIIDTTTGQELTRFKGFDLTWK